MTADPIGLQKYDEVDSFDPSDVRFTGRDSDDDGPPLRTREVAKRSPKVKRMRDSVDTMVRFRPNLLLSATNELTLS